MRLILFLTFVFLSCTSENREKKSVDVVFSLDDFYANNTSSLSPYDITEFIVRDNTRVGVALPYREISFGYEDTKTFLAATHNQLFNLEWGTIDYTQTETTDTVVGEEFKVTLPFSHMKPPNSVLIKL